MLRTTRSGRSCAASARCCAGGTTASIVATTTVTRAGRVLGPDIVVVPETAPALDSANRCVSDTKCPMKAATWEPHTRERAYVNHSSS